MCLSRQVSSFLRYNNFCFLLFVISLLMGCAIASPIQKADESVSGFDGAIVDGDTVIISDNPTNSVRYRIFHQASSGFVPLSTIRQSAEDRARKFCSDQDKIMKILEEKSATPLSGWPSFPRIEYIFVCLEKPYQQISDDSRYRKLRSLKQLQEDGIITQDEFEKEKKRILGSQ